MENGKKPASMGDHEVSKVNIDPNGDVTLELSRTDGKVHLLVFSKVLASVSSLLTAMSSSKIKEGLSNDGASVSIIKP